MINSLAFLVNPIAGTGGELGWKGTDQVHEAWKVTNNEGSPRTRHRARLAAQALATTLPPDTRIFTPAGIMGQEHLDPFISPERLRILTKPLIPTSPNDTIAFLNQLQAHQSVDLLIFVGGDGTAALIARHLATKKWNVPLVGIPSGVKITSECFLKSPTDLKDLITAWKNDNVIFQEAVVTDLDEPLYQEGKIVKHHRGIVTVPYVPRLLQNMKLSSTELHDARELFQEQIMLLAEELERRGVLKHPLIVGPGSTTHGIFKQLGIEKTLLGVDVISNGNIIINDANCKNLTRWFHELPTTERKNVRVILTPIGGQGFILGRGNQQLCCSILDHLNIKQFIIVATEEKLQRTPRLLIDTDCDKFNQHVKNTYVTVIHGYKRASMRKIEQ